MNPSALITVFLTFANKLKHRNLFLIIVSLFIIDLITPDFIPFFDEIILGLLTIFLANWKKDNQQQNEGNLIEGEIIENDKQDS